MKMSSPESFEISASTSEVGADKAETKAEIKKRKLKKVVKGAANMAEGNKKLKALSKGSVPKGLVAIENEAFQKVRTIRKKKASPETAALANDLEKVLDTHDKIIEEQDKAAENPEAFAVENVIAAQPAEVDPELAVSAEEVARDLVPEMKSREQKDLANYKIKIAERSISAATSWYEQTKRDVDKLEQNVEVLEQGMRRILDNEAQAERINTLADAIEAGEHPGWWFPAAKITAADEARVELEGIRSNINIEYDTKRKALETALASASHIKNAGKSSMDYESVEVANPKKPFSELQAVNGDDPELAELSRAHVQNQTAYTEMRVVSEYVKNKATEIEARTNKFLAESQAKKDEIVTAIEAWLAKDDQEQAKAA